MLFPLLLLLLLLNVCNIVDAKLPQSRPHPIVLLKRDLDNLNCLFFRQNCSNHLIDLSSADRLFWKIMSFGTPTASKLNAVSLEIYMESQCPDTTRFIHQQLMKAWSMLSHTGRVELTMIPFGKARCVSSVGDDFLCTCQHGENECLLNQLMNCVIERIGFPEKTVPIINCIQGQSDLDSAMSSCVEKNVLLDKKWAKECATGPHGRRLLAMAGTRTALLNPPLSFVPWIMIDGERNSDALYDLTENLCKKLNPAPEECVEYLRNLRKS